MCINGGIFKTRLCLQPCHSRIQFVFSISIQSFLSEGRSKRNRRKKNYFGQTKLTMLTKLSLHLLNIKSNHGIIWEFSLFALFFLWLFGMQSKVFIWWRITLKCMGYCDFGRLRTLIFRREPLPFPLRKWNTSCFWNSPWSVIHSGLVTS